MKATKKLTVLAACLIAAAALMVTSCNDPTSSFGKDDFFGTWNSSYTYPTDATTVPGGKLDTTLTGHQYKVTMWYNGTSESILKGGEGRFWQHKLHYKADGTTVVSETFWTGTYTLSNNSGITTGYLNLKYEYGYDMKVGTLKIDELITMAEADDYEAQFLNLCFENTDGEANLYNQTLVKVAAATGYYKDSKGIVTVQVRKADEKSDELCSDIEKFDFKLGDSSLTKGYQSMTATADPTDTKCTTINEWEKDLYESDGDDSTTYTAAAGCSWEVNSRTFYIDGYTPATTESSTSNIVAPAASAVWVPTAVPEK